MRHVSTLAFMNDPLQSGEEEKECMEEVCLLRKTNVTETGKGLISSKNLRKIWRKFDFKAWHQS